MKFSIIVPVYNVAQYLPTALDSVVSQTERDWECVCVDDGSCDGSAEILDTYAARDARFHIVHQPNRGVAVARNAALDVVKGEWIVFLDGDDVLAPWALELYADMLARQPDSDMLSLGCTRFPDGEALPWTLQARPERPFPLESEDSSCLISARAFVMEFVQYAYRRVAVGKCRFPTDLVYGEDRFYLVDCLLRARRCSFAQSVAYGYRIRQTSCSNSTWTLQKAENLLRCDRMILEAVGRSGKRLTPEALRLQLNQIMEFAIDKLSQLSSSDRRIAWLDWRAFLPWLRMLRGATPWRRFTIAACSLLPFYWVAVALCAWPHRLKLKGIHR